MNIAGKMKSDRREEHLDRRLHRLLLGGSLPLQARVGRLDAQDAPERDAELVGLDDRAHECSRPPACRRAAAIFFSASGATLADPHLAECELELLESGPCHVLGQLRDRAVEAEAGLDAHREQVERIGQLPARWSPAGASRVERRRSPARCIRAPRECSRTPRRLRRSRTRPDEDAEHDAAAADDALRREERLSADVLRMPADMSSIESDSTFCFALRRSIARASHAMNGWTTRSRNRGVPVPTRRERCRTLRPRGCERAGFVPGASRACRRRAPRARDRLRRG